MSREVTAEAWSQIMTPEPEATHEAQETPQEAPSEETPPTETPTEEKPEEEPKEADDEASKSKIAKRFAALERRDRAIKERADALKEAERHHKLAEESLAPVREIAQLVGTDPLRAMMKLAKLAGKDYNSIYSELTTRMIRGEVPADDDEKAPQKDVLSEVDARLAAHRAEIEQAQAKSRLDEQIRVARGHISRLTTAGEYPLLEAEKASDVEDAVLHMVEQHHASTGKILRYSEALASIEEKLEARANAAAAVLAKRKSPPGKALNQGLKTGPKTLGNGHSTDVGETRRLSFDERLQLARAGKAG